MEDNSKQQSNGVEQTTEAEVNSETTGNTAKQAPIVKKEKSRRWLPYVITAAVLTVLTILIAWWQGGFTGKSSQALIVSWGDAFSVSGALGVAFGLLVLASNGGAFDILIYGFRSFTQMFKKDPIERKYGGYYEYQQAKRSKKRSFWYLVIVGGVFLSVGIVLLIVHLQLVPATTSTE